MRRLENISGLAWKKLERIGDWGFLYSKKKPVGWAVDMRAKGVEERSELYSF